MGGSFVLVSLDHAEMVIDTVRALTQATFFPDFTADALNKVFFNGSYHRLEPCALLVIFCLFRAKASLRVGAWRACIVETMPVQLRFAAVLGHSHRTDID